MESADTQTQGITSMASPLILDSLEIQGFRGFRHLSIEKLGRVNLIAGKNNVGKTALLEALRLYAYRGSPSVVTEILEARDELVRRNRMTEASEEISRYWNFKYLFHGRRNIIEDIETIRIGPVNSQEATLALSLGWFTAEENEEGRRELKQIGFDERDAFENVTLRLIAQIGVGIRAIYRIDSPRRLLVEAAEARCFFTSASGLNSTEVAQLWDNIALTNLEKNVLKSLRIITPEIEDMNLISSEARRLIRSEARPLIQERIPIVRLAGLDEPLPLRSLGDGMNRLFGIALALVNAKDGLLLIDEVENGLHYSVQFDVWKLIFEIARNLNVQVFATTHSWDCIEAFQKAAQESPEDGMLIRLAERKGEIISTLFDERRLTIATQEDIEVR